MNKTRLAEKRYRDKLKKDKKEIRLNTKKIENKIKELEKLKKTMTIIIASYKKQKSQQNYKRKKNMSEIKEES